MDVEMEREEEEEEETESVSEVLRDRFRLSTISIAEAEGTFFLSFSFFCLETEIKKKFVLLFFSEKKWNGSIRTHCRLHFRFGLQICRFIYNPFYSRSYVIIAI